MAKQSRAQKKTIERVMHEQKHGELKTRGGRTVKSRRQAIAVALREAGASKSESKAENARSLRRTKRRERRGETGQARAENRGAARRRVRTRAELYAEAKRRHIPGRSRMNKDQLQRALSR